MKNIFKTKLLGLFLITLLFQTQTTSAWQWSDIKKVTNVTYDDVKNGFFDAKNNFLNFFNADTNPLLQSKNGIIENVDQTTKNLDTEILNTKEIQNKIRRLINTAQKETSNLVDWTKQTSQLENVNNCLSSHVEKLNDLKHFIKDNKKVVSKINEECTNKTTFTQISDDVYKKRSLWQWLMKKKPEIEKPRTFVGQNQRVCTPKLTNTTSYPDHNSLSTEGIKISNLEYGEDFIEKQKEILGQTRQCLTNTQGEYQQEITKVLNYGETANKQYNNFQLEKAKFLIREFLKSITPDNQYLKWILITTLAVGSAEAIYALTYGIINKDLRKGIANAIKFNWNVLKFLPYTLPKWSLNKTIAFTKWSLNKILNGHNGQNINGQPNINFFNR